MTPAHGNALIALNREGSGGDNVKNLGHIAYQTVRVSLFQARMGNFWSIWKFIHSAVGELITPISWWLKVFFLWKIGTSVRLRTLFAGIITLGESLSYADSIIIALIRCYSSRTEHFLLIANKPFLDFLLTVCPFSVLLIMLLIGVYTCPFALYHPIYGRTY